MTQPGPAFVVSSDFNQDGNLDLAVANFDNGTTSILLGDGQGDFTETVLSNGDFAAPNTIALGDVNNDNNIDILVVNNRISTVSIFLGQGDGNFLFQTPISTGSNTTLWGLALGDLNDDGNLDLVVTDSRRYNLLVFFGAGDGTFDQISTLFTGDLSRPYSVLITDLDGNNLLDLLVSNIGTSNIGVFLGDGTGNFNEQSTYATDAIPYRLITADFNGDGIIDAATSNFDGDSVSILLGNGSGTFSPQTSIYTGNGSAPFGIVSGDFDGDTILDLVVTNSESNNIALLIGNGDGSFNQTLIYSTGDDSYPDAVAAGDFNRDGRLDIVSANYLTGSLSFFYNTCV